MPDDLPPEPASSLRGQRLVIIGASSGVGYAAADCALAEGAQVTIGAHDGARLRAARLRLGQRAVGGLLHVSEEASVERFFGALAPFDHLLYMLGDAGPALLSASLMQRDWVAAAAALNVTGWDALMTIDHALPRLSSGGSITLTDHIPAQRTHAGAAPHRVFEHMTRTLAVDLAPVRVNGVRFPAWPRRSARPADIAQAYLDLIRAPDTTGQVLQIPPRAAGAGQASTAAGLTRTSR